MICKDKSLLIYENVFKLKKLICVLSRKYHQFLVKTSVGVNIVLMINLPPDFSSGKSLVRVLTGSAICSITSSKIMASYRCFL